jgi:hypothetical protein
LTCGIELPPEFLRLNFWVDDSKTSDCHSSGISWGDVLRLPKPHPARRRREAQSGSCTEHENVAGGADMTAKRMQLVNSFFHAFRACTSLVFEQWLPSRLPR